MLLALVLIGCGSGRPEPTAPDPRAAQPDAPRPSASCPATLPAPDALPRVTPAHRTLAYWLEHAPGDLDAPLMTPVQIAAHDRALTRDPDQGLPIDTPSLGAAPEPARLDREVRTRLAYVRERVQSGEYVGAEGERADAAELADRPLRVEPELRIALSQLSLRCTPRREGLYKSPVDAAFDRNSCSSVAPQEPVQVLMRWSNGTYLARTRYALGWLADTSGLSPPLSAEDTARVLSGARVLVPAGELALDDGAQARLARAALLPRDPSVQDKLLFADRAGLHSGPIPRGAVATARPLTRRAVLEEAFRHIDRPYGWGGHEGGLDCSSFVMDVLATFGLELPRHSGRQAFAGTYAIELANVSDSEERLRLLDSAASRGVVLLHFPGHIMLYLGRDAGGTPMAIHAFSEYLEPCAGGGETLRRVDRVTVSDLSLGRGTSRRSFLERIDRVVVLGQRAGGELIGVTTPRAATDPDVPAECEDSTRVRIFHSPERPNVRQPLRIYATATEELGPMQLSLIDPSGRRVEAPVRRLGGPPFTWIAEVAQPASGRWTLVLGDGPHVAACDQVAVSPYPPRPSAIGPDEVWVPRWRWEPDTEALYSAFVERLFDYPTEEDLTWRNLHTLLRDRDRNILFDHLSQNEDQRIELEPDCADLPYFLRTYFAWKLRLPFGFRSCTRGRRGQPPTCDELRTPQVAHGQTNEVDAFRWFINTQVKYAVHSASGRTLPNDEDTALYPVPMTRAAIAPGTTFADPYGHLLIVTRWVPQGVSEYGVLMGADAQPDSTVGRRRFWQGTFLFHPDTTHVGAGFKAWRPVLYDRATRTYEVVPNAEITARRGYVPFSTQQYEGTSDDFYDRMMALVNPRPLDAEDMQLWLIDALEESVVRRIVSVDVGEQWVAQNPGRTIEMPEGGAIFQTGGPWEDYSTPSRDMRLLIAIDTVLGFPDVVRRNPARFGLTADRVPQTLADLRERTGRELARREFHYTRSNGQRWRLTLADFVQRAHAFEVAYNPNDCPEVRWGAPESGEEMVSCSRRAPAMQQDRMREYREWFATRRRPIF